MIQGNAATLCLLQWQAGRDFRLISNAYPTSVPHFLHITVSNVASTGSALSLGKDKDPSIKLTATQVQFLPPASAAGLIVPSWGFIPLQLHPLPKNCELPSLPAITLHCLICSPAKSLVSKSCGSEFWRLIMHFLCPVIISWLSSSMH